MADMDMNRHDLPACGRSYHCTVNSDMYLSTAGVGSLHTVLVCRCVY